MNKIFPEEIIEFSAEEHFFRNNVRGRPVYVFFIVLVVALIISLPVIKVDITYSTRGILRTAEEATRIIIPREGEVSTNTMEVNQYVEQGDTLLILKHTSISTELGDTEKAISLLRNYISDLRILLSGKGNPETVRFQQVSMEYTHEMSRLKSDYAYVYDEYRTTKELYENGFIARLEYEAVRRRYLSSEASLEVGKKEFQNRWQTELSGYKLQLLQLNTKYSHLKTTEEMHILLAPVSGYLCDYQEIKPGSYLGRNEIIARIVPDHELIASCMVGPDKISRIRTGQPMRLNIDAFPGSSYGRIEGVVKTVAEDATNFSGSPAFPIICKIEQEFTGGKYTSGTRLRSGMTFTGLFIISRKSLWQLIIEKGEKLLIPAPSYSNNEKKPTIKS